MSDTEQREIAVALFSRQ